MSRHIVNVGILRAADIRFTLHGTFTLDSIPLGAGDYRVAMDGARLTLSTSEGDAIAKTDAMEMLPADGACSFTICDVVIGIGFHWQRCEDQTFTGTLRFIVEDGMVRAVNSLDIEDYLLSVISSEMSASATTEFLKAHAVISRSWLINRMTAAKCQANTISHQSADRLIRWYDHDDHLLFDVCADDHCQRYQGITRARESAERWSRVSQVIESTRGQVLTYQGEVCDARFSKCCGGMLEQYESCWDATHKPYLISKPDPYCNTSDARILAQVLNGYDQETVDFYRWTVSYTTSELSALIARKSGFDFGTVTDLQPVLRGPSGRIIELRIVGTLRTMTVGKELEIRKWLSESHLYSSAFDVERTASGFTLRGRGWGHGVGLCQIGAAVMGDSGFDYRAILSHYYPGTDIIVV